MRMKMTIQKLATVQRNHNCSRTWPADNISKYYRIRLSFHRGRKLHSVHLNCWNEITLLQWWWWWWKWWWWWWRWWWWVSDWRFDNLCGGHLQSQSELYHVSWWYQTLVIDLTGQLSRHVRLSVKPWYCLLWRLEMSLVRFDLSIVTV